MWVSLVYSFPVPLDGLPVLLRKQSYSPRVARFPPVALVSRTLIRRLNS